MSNKTIRNQYRLRSPLKWRRAMVLSLVVASIAVGQAGCQPSVPTFGTSQLLEVRLSKESGSNLELAKADTRAILVDLFGTPDLPKVPDFLADEPDFQGLVSLENLTYAAGPVKSNREDVHFGLYREHCATCHGITGDGYGPAASMLSPYPRDFRMGLFKFKATPRGIKPQRRDLMATLVHGFPGSGMPSFQAVRESERQALIDYVIYLSIRGEVERRLLMEAAMQLDVEAGERLAAFTPDGEIDKEAAPESWSRILNIVQKVAQSWAVADQMKRDIPEPPVVSDMAQSIERGKELFRGQVANCAACHGIEGHGDGGVIDYDDWTKDWTVRAGIDPADKAAVRPMRKLGGLKPVPDRPRDLTLGVYRGGSRPSDIYLRIVNGIEGTPMPAAAVKPSNPQGMTEAEVWDLVNYVLSLAGDNVTSSGSDDAGDRAPVPVETGE